MSVPRGHHHELVTFNHALKMVTFKHAVSPGQTENLRLLPCSRCSKAPRGARHH